MPQSSIDRESIFGVCMCNGNKYLTLINWIIMFIKLHLVFYDTDTLDQRNIVTVINSDKFISIILNCSKLSKRIKLILVPSIIISLNLLALHQGILQSLCLEMVS